MSDKKKVTGSCMCGSIKFETTADSTWTWYCHCTDCRRQSGAPVVMYVGFPIDEVHWSGDERAQYESSPGIFWGFCKKCGSSLTYEGGLTEVKIFEIHIGTIDQADNFPPKKHWFHNERIKWFDTTDHEVRLDGEGKPYRFDPAV